MENKYNVKVGQIWQDNDRRYKGFRVRMLEVLEVGDIYAVCINRVFDRKTRIKLNRFRSNNTGYCLIKDIK